MQPDNYWFGEGEADGEGATGVIVTFSIRPCRPFWTFA